MIGGVHEAWCYNVLHGWSVVHRVLRGARLSRCAVARFDGRVRAIGGTACRWGAG